jgi:hypothetical protein
VWLAYAVIDLAVWNDDLIQAARTEVDSIEYGELITPCGPPTIETPEQQLADSGSHQGEPRPC